MLPASDTPLSPVADEPTASPPRVVPLAEGGVRLVGATGGAELAGRLLAAEEVRSVVLDHERSEATVHFFPDAADVADDRSALSELASLAANQQAALADGARRLNAASEIVCWVDPERGVDSYFRAPKMATGWKRYAYLTGAAVTFALAVIGAVLPGLPTTPFLLLTSYCLIRSSHRWHQRLLRSRVFGGLLRDWHTHRAVRPGVKFKSLAVMGLVIGLTFALSGMTLPGKITVAGLSMIGVVCICRLRVIR